MNFKNWSMLKELQEKNEFQLFYKTQLKEKELKPKNENIFEIHKVYTGGKWKEFKFYSLDNVIEIKKKKKSVIRELDITIDNLCESLYIINKSAKKSRDSKQNNYYKKFHGIVNRCKERQENLYNLKNIVIDKMIDNNYLKLKGYHIQNINNEKVYLLYYTYKNYGFHVIEDKINDDIKFLGEIDELISSKVNKKTNIKYNEAINLLNKFIN